MDLVIKILGVVLLLSACVPTKDSDSDSAVKYGHLIAAKNPEKWLISLPPNSIICVHGNLFEDYIVSALKKWAEPIGRVGSLKIIVANSKYPPLDPSKGPGAAFEAGCTIDASVSAYWLSEEDDQIFGSRCSSGKALAGTRVEVNKAIMLCKGLKATPEIIEAVILHEVGHLWGLCDRYTSSHYGSGASNCDPANSTSEDPLSVMGARARPLPIALATDDIKGMQALVARTDLPNHKLWLPLPNGDVPPPAKPVVTVSTTNALVCPEAARFFADTCWFPEAQWQAWCPKGMGRKIFQPTDVDCSAVGTLFSGVATAAYDPDLSSCTISIDGKRDRLMPCMAKPSKP